MNTGDVPKLLADLVRRTEAIWASNLRGDWTQLRGDYSTHIHKAESNLRNARADLAACLARQWSDRTILEAQWAYGCVGYAYAVLWMYKARHRA